MLMVAPVSALQKRLRPETSLARVCRVGADGLSVGVEERTCARREAFEGFCARSLAIRSC